jgi:hypothetical protein
MNISTKNTRWNVFLHPKRLFTQKDLDASFQKGKRSKPAVEAGVQEAVQIDAKQKSIDKNTVEGLIKKSNRVLVTIYSHMFPFDPYPNSVNIEEGRLTFITRHFFFSSEVHTVDIKDISNIFINTAPFYAQLVVISKTFEENTIKVEYLRKKDAIYARRIIEGLRVFDFKKIDTSVYSRKELMTKLEELSKTAIVG